MEQEVGIPKDNREQLVANAQMLMELKQDPRFQLLFEEMYVDAYAITNIYNIHGYDDATKRRFFEKFTARSHFVKFMEDILEDGRNAQMSLQQEVDDNSDDELVDTEIV